MFRYGVHLRSAVGSETFWQILDSLPSPMALVDTDGRVVAVNRAWNEWHPDDRPGSVASVFATSGSSHATSGRMADTDAGAALERVLQEGHQETGRLDWQDFVIRHLATDQPAEDGRPAYSEPVPPRAVRLRISRITDSGPVRLLVVRDDATQLREAEQEICRLHSAMEEQTGTDCLTGIASRRRLDQTLEEEWKRNERTQTPLSVALLDIDRFKQFNDSRGHLAGDRCLQQVAAAIRNGLRRPGDLAARFGGDEFAVILPNTPEAGAVRVLSTILQNVRALWPGDPGLPDSAREVTLSAGCATTIPERQRAPLSLLQRADEAMYAAKHQGGDRVVCGSGPSDGNERHGRLPDSPVSSF